MPKNKGSGGKKFKQNKSSHQTFSAKNMAIKEEIDEHYGIVTKSLGNCRFMVQVLGKTSSILCTLKKSIRKKMYICAGTLVLLIVREYQPDHGDIIYPYDQEEVHLLIQDHQVPENILSLLAFESSQTDDTISSIFQSNNDSDQDPDDINIDEI